MAASFVTLLFAASLAVGSMLAQESVVRRTQFPRLVIVGHLNFAVVSDWLDRYLGVPSWIVTYGIEAWGFAQWTTLDKTLDNIAAALSLLK